MSPAYDLTYSADQTVPAYLNRHSLTVNGKNENITRYDLEKIGMQNDIQDSKDLIDAVANAIANFETYAKDLAIDNHLIASMKADFVKM